MRVRYPRSKHTLHHGLYIIVRDGRDDLGGGYYELRNTHTCDIEHLVRNYGPNLANTAYSMKNLPFFYRKPGNGSVINATVHRTPQETDEGIGGKVVLLIGPLNVDELVAYHEYSRLNPTLVPCKSLQRLLKVKEDDEDDTPTDTDVRTGVELEPVLNHCDCSLDGVNGIDTLLTLDYPRPTNLVENYPLLTLLMLRCYLLNRPPVQFEMNSSNRPSLGLCQKHGSNLIPTIQFGKALKNSLAVKLQIMKEQETSIPEDEYEKCYIFNQVWWFIHQRIGASDAYDDKSYFFSFKKTVNEYMAINQMLGKSVLEVYTLEGETQRLYHKSSKHEWDCIGWYDFTSSQESFPETKPLAGTNFGGSFDTRPCYVLYQMQLARS